jgi:phage gpG-like protein
MVKGKADTSKWEALTKRIKDAQHISAHVGVLANKGGNAQVGESGLTLVELAAIHEFGSADGHIPERSFIRGTLFARVADQLKHRVTEAVKEIAEDKTDVKTAIGRLGAWAAAEIKNTISRNEADGYGDYPYPPLADSTIAAKGSSTPLVDTGQLLNSITWEVVDDRSKR